MPRSIGQNWLESVVRDDYLPESYEVGVKAVLVRTPDHEI
jgi:hypothetical protein